MAMEDYRINKENGLEFGLYSLMLLQVHVFQLKKELIKLLLKQS